MLVLNVTECPPALRGDLSGWLQEIDTGVYVGQVSQRVREEIWKRTVAHLKKGRAVMVFSARNEQRMDFKIHNASWELIDFDGLKLMLRPSAARQHARASATQAPMSGYSTASRMRFRSRTKTSLATSSGLPGQFVIMDLETTGLQAKAHEVIEFGAIRVVAGQETACFQALVRPQNPLPKSIIQLTHITPDMLEREGRPLLEVLLEFLSFLQDDPIIAHNIAFDLDFLREACNQTGLAFPGNRRIDTLNLSERYLIGVENHQLETLMRHLNLPYPTPHRSLPDCRATLMLVNKLIEIREHMT